MKKSIAFTVLIFLFAACEEEIFVENEELLLKKAEKITICHNGNPITVSMNALEAHLDHGDEILDADGDGFTAVGACSGSMDDCNDNDSTVFPGAEEICGDNIDNNCNGEVDEDCEILEGTFIDSRDDTKYKWVKIGDQTWMAENLRYLPKISDKDYFKHTYIPLYYTNGSFDSYDKYGTLYNYEAAINACPDGWHLPTDEEWKQLELFLGMPENLVNKDGYSRGMDEGTKLKSTSGWLKDYGIYGNLNANGTDEYGFSALPGGSYAGGSFRKNQLNHGVWWTATSYPTIKSSSAWTRILSLPSNYTGDGIGRKLMFKGNGLSVRCLKDDIPESNF